ncbi:MAG: Ig-like domain-containing protein [Candidatus Bathyarchaeia archaeon]
MRVGVKVVAIVVVYIMLLLATFQAVFSNGYTLSYKLIKSQNGAFSEYKLNVHIPTFLYQYYRSKDHKLTSPADFAKFVTPYALKPIADKLREIYSDDEEFANGVLMLVHQIPYLVTESARYPVETLVDNGGDCDLLSYVAASIMKAGSLDVVLLYYENINHMNLGVNLPKEPKLARQPPVYIMYRGTRYYIAECTGGLDNGWRVGECPSDLKNEKVKIITLEKCEQKSPGQVSVSYLILKPSALNLTLSSNNFILQGEIVMLQGALSPALSGRNITLYIKAGSSSWNILAEVKTDSRGFFSYPIKFNLTGVYFFRANWSGDENYIGAGSPVISVFVVSPFWLFVLITMFALICITVVIIVLKCVLKSMYTRSIPKLPEIDLEKNFYFI